MKTILAPTDFSASSVNAVNYAADLAVTIKAKLVLFHAIPFPIAVSEISVPADFIDDMMEVSERDMNELSENIQARTKNKIAISTELKIGTVEQEIASISARERPLAIVLGMRSGKSLERALMGSSIFHIMNHIGFPTLIIPENARFKEIKNIGLACDFKKVDEKMPFETIAEWLSLFKGNLDIINIGKGNKEFEVDQVVETRSIQNRLAAFNPRFHFLTGDNIAAKFNEFVNTHSLDLLMVFPRKHGIFNLFLKKKSRFIVNHSQSPILSIHESKD